MSDKINTAMTIFVFVSSPSCSKLNGIPYDTISGRGKNYVNKNCFDCCDQLGEYIAKDSCYDGIKDCSNGSDDYDDKHCCKDKHWPGFNLDFSYFLLSRILYVDISNQIYFLIIIARKNSFFDAFNWDIFRGND